MGISVTGISYALAAQKNMAKKDAINIAVGLEKCAHTLLQASQKLVPVEYGPLKKSGRVEVKGVGFGAKAFVIYDTEYAVFVHEILTAYHEPPTQARYLADAVPKVRGAMTNILKRQISVGRTYEGITG